jgi:RES domain-containing protein
MSEVRIYRVLHVKYADEPFSGEGGLHASSRWASKGQRVTYAADSLALAVLEKVAGAGRLKRLREMMYVPARLDRDSVQGRERDDLPEGWDRRPPGAASRKVGDRWLQEKQSVALAVPSVTLPEGTNYVLNPDHPGFAEVLTVGSPAQLDLDTRILGKLLDEGGA